MRRSRPVSQTRISFPVQRLSDPRHSAVSGSGGPRPAGGRDLLGRRQPARLHGLGGAFRAREPGLDRRSLPGRSVADSLRPRFRRRRAAHRLWTADAVYLDPRWIASKDPHADYAIARVNSDRGGSVESHVGLALVAGHGTAFRQSGHRDGVSVRRGWFAHRLSDQAPG